MDGIYAVTNTSAEILMYIQILILVKAAFLIEEIRRSSLIIKNKPTKQHLMDYVLNLCVNVRINPTFIDHLQNTHLWFH